MDLALWRASPPFPAGMLETLKGVCLTYLKDLHYLISGSAFKRLEGKQTLVIGSSLDDLEVTLFLSALWLIQVSV